jgi:hypothetical protein
MIGVAGKTSSYDLGNRIRRGAVLGHQQEHGSSLTDGYSLAIPVKGFCSLGIHKLQ